MTTSPSTEVDVINALSLLAHKVAPNVFDLSSLQWHVSIRDQIVRAQLLMADLKAADPKIDSVLIVGMGAAGISAAMTACELGIPRVCVVDKANAPFELLRGVSSRFVGPFMYEWPSSFHTDQSYPSHASTPWMEQGHSSLTWNAKQPITADQLATELSSCWTTWLASRISKGLSLPDTIFNADPAVVKSFVKAFADAEGMRANESADGQASQLKAQFSAGRVPLQPDYLILAAGMGKETLTLPGCRQVTPSFWGNDTLKHRSTRHKQVVVLGGGDGALQDTLRALTNYDHPLSFIQDLQRNSTFQSALAIELPALLDADRQMRQHSAWVKGAQGQAMVDFACQQAAKRLAANSTVRRFVLGCIRPGTGIVWLCVAGTHFDKAYLLNRFAIHLLLACYQKKSRRPTGRMGFEVRFSTKVSQSRRPAPATTGKFPHAKAKCWTLRVCSEDDEATIKADKLVVRFGVKQATIPGLQMLQLGVPNERDLKQRATLKGIELPFVAM